MRRETAAHPEEMVERLFSKLHSEVALMWQEKNLDKKLEYVLKKLVSIPQVAAIILFGSVARGKAIPTSDIDLAVLLSEDVEFGELKKLEVEVGSLADNDIDLALLHKLPYYIQRSVFEEGIVVFLRDERADKILKNALFHAIKGYIENERMYKMVARSLRKKLMAEGRVGEDKKWRR